MLLSAGETGDQSPSGNQGREQPLQHQWVVFDGYPVQTGNGDGGVEAVFPTEILNPPHFEAKLRPLMSPGLFYLAEQASMPITWASE